MPDLSRRNVAEESSPVAGGRSADDRFFVPSPGVCLFLGARRHCRTHRRVSVNLVNLWERPVVSELQKIQFILARSHVWHFEFSEK